MTNLEFLKAYRSVTMELRLMRREHEHLLERIDHSRRHHGSTQRLQEHLEHLEQLIADAKQRQSTMQPQFEALVSSTMNERIRVTVLQYYGMGLYDSEIADMMFCSQRSINGYRHRFLDSLDEHTSA